MAGTPRIPDFAEGEVFAEDFQDFGAYARSITPKAGPGIRVDRTPGGSIISSEPGGSSGGKLALLQEDIPPPSWDGTTLIATHRTATILSTISNGWEVSETEAEVWHTTVGGGVLAAGALVAVFTIDSRYVTTIYPCDTSTSPSFGVSSSSSIGTGTGVGSPASAPPPRDDGSLRRSVLQSQKRGDTSTGTGVGSGGSNPTPPPAPPPP